MRIRGLKGRMITGPVIACLGFAGGLTGAGPVAAARNTSASPAVVRTDAGLVRGVVSAGYRSFQGIPYAAPPVGSLRWAMPEAPAPWAGVRDATKPGNACPQAPFFGTKASNTEDCLYLNVTTPRRTGGRHLPVLVWIHGGGYSSGAGADFDAAKMATRGGVVVVTINYRFSVFGMLAHPALNGASGQQLSGNFWFADQQAALRWVHRNAAAFGGNAGNVTVAGESAGALSVCAHLTAPGSAGLFQRAIVQSAPCTLTTQWPNAAAGSWLPRDRATAESYGEAVAAKLGCRDMATAAACLRAVPESTLLAATNGGFRYGPVVGGGLLPISPAQALATGRFRRVPVMEGFSRDEYRFFTAAVELWTGHPLTPADYAPQLATTFDPTTTAAVLAHYPLRDYSSTSVALSTIWTSYTWACPALETARLLSERVPTYTYEFADENAPWIPGVPAPSFPTGAYHSSEEQYLFPAGSEGGLSDQMVGYWTKFAHTGDPNGHGTPAWMPFDTTFQWVQQLAPGPGGIRPIDDVGREHQCDFWSTTEHARSTTRP